MGAASCFCFFLGASLPPALALTVDLSATFLALSLAGTGLADFLALFASPDGLATGALASLGAATAAVSCLGAAGASAATKATATHAYKGHIMAQADKVNQGDRSSTL